MASPYDLTYPVLSLRGATVVGYPDVTALTTAFTSEVRSGYFTGLQLLDSAGRQFLVVSASLPHLTILQRLLEPLWTPRVRVDLDLQPAIKQRSFEELHAAVLRYLRRDPVWQSRDDPA